MSVNTDKLQVVDVGEDKTKLKIESAPPKMRGGRQVRNRTKVGDVQDRTREKAKADTEASTDCGPQLIVPTG